MRAIMASLEGRARTANVMRNTSAKKKTLCPFLIDLVAQFVFRSTYLVG
jgi:hypothetical protein